MARSDAGASLDAGPVRVEAPSWKAPAGGETLDWSASTRRQLRQLGEAARFIIAEPYTPDVLQVHFREEEQRHGGKLHHTVDPVAQATGSMTKFGEYLTACEIDLAGLLPLPVALVEFLNEVAAADLHLRSHGLLYPELNEHEAVAGFELESSAGKHAGGGLLNLAAYCVVGVAVTPDEIRTREIDATLRRYRPTLGLRNVRVRTVP